MKDIVLDRLIVVCPVSIRLFLGFEIDRGAVIRGADRAGEKGAVVAGIVPGETSLVTGILPEPDREFHEFDRAGAIQYDSLAIGFDLLAAPRPQIGIPERIGVAEGVRQGLTKRVPLRLQLFSGRTPFLPGLRIIFRPDADLVPPRGAVGDLQTDDRVRDGEPFPAVEGNRLRCFIEPVLSSWRFPRRYR